MTVTEDRPASILGQRLLRREDPALPTSPHNVWKAIQAAANPVNANNPANRGATK